MTKKTECPFLSPHNNHCSNKDHYLALGKPPKVFCTYNFKELCPYYNNSSTKIKDGLESPKTPKEVKEL